jgi:hypothetical protein
MEIDLPTETAALVAAGAALGEPRKNPDFDGKHYALLPDGFTMHELPTHDKPVRPVATVKLRDAASFVQYVNDHRLARSRIYATLEPAKFLAVFDDFDTARRSVKLDVTNIADDAPNHEVQQLESKVFEQADWRQFRASFEVPPSREWKLWTGQDRKLMAQVAFAEFLQDNLPDVTQPDGATLLEMALNFEASTSGSFVASQRLHDGSHDLVWKADNNASGKVKLPQRITISIPVFENEARATLGARLLHRIADGKLMLRYELERPHVVMEAAFRTTWARIAHETTLPILLGAPE